MEIKDSCKLKDSMNDSMLSALMRGGPKRTHITITDHETGEIIQEGHNKILVPGSQSTACKQFGIDQAVAFPTYNSALGLENSYDDYQHQPDNTPIVCLWCAGRSGYGATAGDVIVPTNTDRIKPTLSTTDLANQDIIPFRYVPIANDLSAELRGVYYGRQVNKTTNYISYYFKAFDTTPQLHIRYLDGTEVTSAMWSVDSTQSVEVYMEMRLALTKKDFREYFDSILGWDRGDISTISLCTAWHRNDISEDPTLAAANQVYYNWYQDILPFSKWNFKSEDLSNLTRALDFNYQVYY